MNLKEFSFLCNNTKALLVGDIMLDRYVSGKVNRISPEAPVPIFSTNASNEVLGGAGNVFNNLVSLGVLTTLISVVGKDNYGQKIEKMVNKIKNSNIYIYKEKNKPTTVKTRYTVNGQQIIRVDEENTQNYKDLVHNSMLKNFKREL